MDGEMDWIAARFLLSTILGVHPLVVLDDGGGDGGDERFPVDDDAARGQQREAVPLAAVEAPEGVAGRRRVGVRGVHGGGRGVAGRGAAAVRALVPRRLHRAVAADQGHLPDVPGRAAPAGGRGREAAADGGGGGGDGDGRLRREASYTVLAAGMLPS
ncbi:unnamed protein product [Urochloa decumbens]|uniref:Uncharacterized protein n=1 Tax=Urochloa decumbens TaxID=240449 RepID=A0ABC8VIH7_9POAL